MREIKFRAWDNVQGKMLSVEAIDFRQQYISLNEGDNSVTDTFEMFELMQCTGLKDMNGKEIYEGDIVKGHWYGGWPNIQHRLIGEVKYFRNSYLVFGVKQYTDICKDLTRDYEVIGNIYENPELLEKI